MRKLLLFAVLALPACTHAQNTGIKLPSPVRVLPGPPSVGSGKRSEILIPDENNANPLIINHQAAGAFATIDASFTNTFLALYGSTTTDGRIYLQPGSVSGKNSVIVQAGGATFAGPSLIVLDARVDQGLDVRLNGTSYLKLDSSTFTNVPHFITPDHYEFAGGPLEPQDVFPLFNNLYDNGAALARWAHFYTQNADVSVSATFSFLGGGGARCATISNTGLLGAAACAGGGTVTSTSWTGGIVSIASPTTTPAFTVAGTSGGVPYFNSASTWASSGALTANLPVFGGGAGSAPFSGTRSGNTTQVVTTTGTQTSGDCVKIDANGNHIAAGGACATAGANTSLSNIGSTAVNADILPGVTNSINLGSSSKNYLSANAATFTASAGGTRKCIMETNDITCTGALGGTTFTVNSNSGNATFGTIGGTSITASSFVTGSELRVSGNVVINSSGILANAFGVDVSAGIAGTGFNIHGGAAGVTSTTCSQWTGGICTAP